MVVEVVKKYSTQDIKGIIFFFFIKNALFGSSRHIIAILFYRSLWGIEWRKNVTLHEETRVERLVITGIFYVVAWIARNNSQISIDKQSIFLNTKKKQIVEYSLIRIYRPDG